MKTNNLAIGIRKFWLLAALAAWPGVGTAQVAVPEIEEVEEFPTLTASEIEDLVGPIALYPDDLLAIVLPAATFPLQVVEAARFLEALENDPSLEPDEDWDDSIVALLNYPEVVELMNEDLEWTWRLGEAFVAQQADVIDGIETFRDRAYDAGNLKSDDYQLVAQDDDTISITPVQEDVIYVPYYEPEQVVVYQARPVYYYYPRAYPVYYYPYPAYYPFHDHFYYSWFWGVTTAFTIGWHSHHLNVYHSSFWGHPYYGHTYWDHWWYRRPDIHVYNNVYVRNNVYVSRDRYRNGDRWVPRDRHTVRPDQRVTRSHYYPGSGSSQVARNSASRTTIDRGVGSRSEREPVQFRDRSGTPRPGRNDTSRSGFAPEREPRASQSQSRPGEPRSVQPRATESRQAQPRATTPRPSVPRLTSPRQSSESRATAPRQSSGPRVTSPRQSSEPRLAAPRTSQPRVSIPQSSQPRAAAPRTSQPRVSAPSQSRGPSHSASSSHANASRSDSGSRASSQRSSRSGEGSSRRKR